MAVAYSLFMNSWYSFGRQKTWLPTDRFNLTWQNGKGWTHGNLSQWCLVFTISSTRLQLLIIDTDHSRSNLQILGDTMYSALAQSLGVKQSRWLMGCSCIPTFYHSLSIKQIWFKILSSPIRLQYLAPGLLQAVCALDWIWLLLSSTTISFMQSIQRSYTRGIFRLNKH